MSNSVTRGSTTWVQQSIEATSDPRNGDTTTITGTATNQTDAVNKALYYRNSGWSVSIKQQGKADLWTVTATFNADAVTDPSENRIPDIQWEVQPHVIDKNIFECDDRPFIKTLSTSTKALIEAACKQANKDGNPVLTTAKEVSQLPNAKIAYNLKVIGVDAKQIFTTSLKRTITVSTRYNVSWALNNNDCILSRGFLISTYNVPVWVASLMPDSDDGIQADKNGVTTYWGYLENQPAYQSVAGNRVQISQEWVYNKWSAGDNGLYDIRY